MCACVCVVCVCVCVWCSPIFSHSPTALCTLQPRQRPPKTLHTWLRQPSKQPPSHDRSAIGWGTPTSTAAKAATTSGSKMEQDDGWLSPSTAPAPERVAGICGVGTRTQQHHSKQHQQRGKAGRPGRGLVTTTPFNFAVNLSVFAPDPMATPREKTSPTQGRHREEMAEEGKGGREKGQDQEETVSGRKADALVKEDERRLVGTAAQNRSHASCRSSSSSGMADACVPQQPSPCLVATEAVVVLSSDEEGDNNDDAASDAQTGGGGIRCGRDSTPSRPFASHRKRMVGKKPRARQQVRRDRERGGRGGREE